MPLQRTGFCTVVVLLFFFVRIFFVRVPVVRIKVRGLLVPLQNTGFCTVVVILFSCYFIVSTCTENQFQLCVSISAFNCVSLCISASFKSVSPSISASFKCVSNVCLYLYSSKCASHLYPQVSNTFLYIGRNLIFGVRLSIFLHRCN